MARTISTSLSKSLEIRYLRIIFFKFYTTMKIKHLFIFALTATLAFTMVACGTTQKKEGEKKADEMEELFDEEYEEEYGEEYIEDELGGEVALDGDPNKADYIVISKESMTLNLYDSDGGLIFSFPVAIGKVPGNKQQAGDMKTPEGDFSISQIQDSSEWAQDLGDGNGEVVGVYGNWYLRLKVPPYTSIAIHGTNQPETIGTRCTDGCIRLINADLDKLKPLVRVGMKVTIESSVMDMEADGRTEENGVNKTTIADDAADAGNIFDDLEANKGDVATVDPAKVVATENIVDHVIVEGESFASLAKQYGTTTDRIQKLNPDVDPRRIQIGQKIRVKGGEPLSKVTATTTTTTTTTTTVAAGEEVYHTIESGDTFGHLAVKYETTSKRIQELNPDLDPTKLQLGQKVRVK